MDDWQGLPQNDMTTVEQLAPVADYLTQSGDRVALSSYWYASELTELTNGNVITSQYWELSTAPSLTYVFYGTWKEPFLEKNRPLTIPLVVKNSEISYLLELCPEVVLEKEFYMWSVFRVDSSLIDFSML